MIVLYDIEFTQTDRLNATRRNQIIETLKKQSEAAYNMLPFNWKEIEGHNNSRKKLSRTR
eukprot:561003-Pleurochrysis_carterae.AAC.1